MSGKRVMPGLGLTAFWPYKSDNWNTEMDANLVLLSAITGRVTVESRVTAVADMDPTKVYLVPSGAGSNPNKIAIWNNDPVPADQAWIYITPLPGWSAFIVNEAVNVVYLYGAWAPSQFDFSKQYMEVGYDQRWQTPTINAAFTPYAGRQVPRFRAAMTFCDLDFELSVTSAPADNTVITTLPVGCRPPLPIVLPVQGLGAYDARILIGSDGTVKCLGFSVGGIVYAFHGSFSLI